MDSRFNRREFMMGSGAMLALSAMAWPGRGRAAALEVPTVDSLVVKVLTDSSFDTPVIRTHKMVKVRRARYFSIDDVNKALHNEWGLALATESRIGADTRNLMLDFGYTPRALLNNMEVMGVDGAKTQALIVSHGHFDHFGGLVAYLERFRGQLPADLALYAGGEDNFCARKTATGVPGHFTDWGVLDRRDLEKLKLRIVKCEKPTVIQGHAFTTGNIARRSFERLPGGRVLYRKAADGAGCEMPEQDAKAPGQYVDDQMLDEHATCFNVRDRGLVVISSCGHSGIVNTVRQAMEVSGITKLHAVMGGFHLFAAEDAYLQRTVAELQAMNPDALIPLHCSGPEMVRIVRAVAPEKLVTSTTGTEFTFGA